MFEVPGQNENRMPLTFNGFICKNVCNMQLRQGLAVIFSHRQVYALLTYTWRCENITASPCGN